MMVAMWPLASSSLTLTFLGTLAAFTFCLGGFEGITKQSQRVKITPRDTVETRSQLGNPMRTWRQLNQSPHDLMEIKNK